MKKLSLIFSVFMILVSGLTSCSKDSSITDSGDDSQGRKVLVLNQGLYSQNNSSLTVYNIDSSKAQADAYFSANKTLLGDDANSMEIFQGKLFIAVDNSNKIEVLDAKTYKSLAVIKMNSPRRLCFVSSSLAYATNLTTNTVTAFNPSTCALIKTINVGSKPEGIVESMGNLFVANSDYGYSNSSVSMIKSDGSVITKSIGSNPRFLVKDAEGAVYLIASGPYLGDGAVYKIDPNSFEVLKTLAIKNNPQEPIISGDKMYLINNDGVQRLSLSSFSLDPFSLDAKKINPVGSSVYSLCYDSKTGRLYCANPKDYQQKGEIVVFDSNGNELSRFPAGINPGCMRIEEN